MRVNAVIVAAGEGRRMGMGVPKALLRLSGRPLILHTLGRFAASRSVRKIILVTPESEVSNCRELVQSDPDVAGLQYVFQAGGRKRQDSVRRGLDRIDGDCEVVIIHDGVRPFVSPGLIDRCVEVASREGAVVLGIPVQDTVKVVAADRLVRETPARDSLWQIQTPQAFQTRIIREAYDQAAPEGDEATDDATLVERLGKPVTVLEGERTNIKITVPEDLVFAEALLREGLVS